MKIILVYNPKSGSALRKSELRQKFAAAAIDIDEFIAIEKGFEKYLSPYIAEGRNIGVIGGDGTISAVAGLVANTNATLIPLPGGTLNHFTKDLGVPQDIDDALAHLKKRHPRTVDIASINEKMFINNSSIGLYPASLRDREEIEPHLGKWPAAVAASLRALVHFKTYHVTIGDTFVTTPFIFVGNNRYSLDSPGGTERSSLTEGILTVYIAKTQSRFTLLKIALFALVGKSNQVTEFEEFYPKTLTIETKRRHLSVSHDGEVSKLAPPLTYSIHIKALRILA